MEQDLLEEAQEQAGVWVEVAAEAEWVVIVREQAPAEIVFARIAARDYSISKACLVIQ